MQNLKVIKIKGMRVLTSKQLAQCYEAEEKQIKQNSANNRARFVEGKHYIALREQDLKMFKNKFENFDLVGKTANKLFLWTEKGALLHAKSLNTDKAWEVYDYLVDFYFRAQKQKPEVGTGQKDVHPKASGREVVDIPENVKMQRAMQEVRRYLNTMDVIVQEYNKYQCKESYIHLEKVLSNLWVSLGDRVTDLMKIEPNLVRKPY